MPDWFTVERLDSVTFAISEYGHWEEPHSYLLLGSARAALIDTGLGVANIREVVDDLTALPVCVLTTHAHWDHIGGHGYFSEIAIHAAEADWLNGRFPLPLEAVKANLARGNCAFPERFSVDDYRIFQGAPERVLRDGDRIDLGGRVLTAIHTPGHSPGHCCFYEVELGDLFTGDLIYRGCLDAFYPTTDPLEFARSVRKVRGLRVRRVLPGHHSLNVAPELIDRVAAAFDEIESQGRLRWGEGILSYGDFQIHV